MDKDRRDSEDSRRQAAMAVLAGADAEGLARLCEALDLPAAHAVRGPETGLVTVRGRLGGGGAAFNVGEATVTRATVRLANGTVGHAYALGRDARKARLSAILDAVWQDPARRAEVETRVLAPLRDDQRAADEALRAETAATRVDFFTLVRGED